MHCASSIEQAAWFGSAATVDLLLEYKADTNKGSKAGALAPHLAARVGHVAVLDKLWCLAAVDPKQREIGQE